MNTIHSVIKEQNLNAVMLLQIHDELIFEVDANEAQMLGEKFQNIMESVMELNIPLKASLNIGNNWSELK
jgi:DNA polymerase-1